MLKNINRAIIAIVTAAGLATTAFAQVLPVQQYTQPAKQDSVMVVPDRLDPQVRENDAGRFGLVHSEVMQRLYDVSGQKSEWTLGTSILGNPELEPAAMGMASVSRRYPAMLSGIYTTRLGFDPSRLSLNGENGILFEERHGVPVDTPVTDVAWERGAFAGNALHLDFRRLITDSVTLDFGVQSRSNKLSKEYDYQNVTSSPYFALGRDSSSIPFTGRNIAVNSMHVQPVITWRFGLGKAFFKMNYLSLENADNTSHKVLLDTLDLAKRTFQKPPYTIDEKTITYGGGIELYPIKKLTVATSFHYGTHEIEEDSLARIGYGTKTWKDTLGILRTDSLYYDTVHNYTYNTILGDASVRYAMFLNPAVHFQYEFVNTDDERAEFSKTYYQDREIGYGEISDTLSFVFFRAQVGMQRNSSLLDRVDFAPAYSADATFNLPFHLKLNAMVRHDNKFPDVKELKFVETGRLSFPNEDLDYERRNRQALNIGWYSREVFYGLGLRHESATNLIKQRWVLGEGMESVDEAFRWANLGEASTWDWLFKIGFRLGNWKFYLERGQVLDREEKIIDTPELYYKGGIHWQNRFVQNRLGVSVRVDWQWFGDRYDCTVNEEGMPELEQMKKYLALDFEARMQILSFELYSRIENFNHSIYMPASGYTPEGLRFAYGIVWTFGN